MTFETLTPAHCRVNPPPGISQAISYNSLAHIYAPGGERDRLGLSAVFGGTVYARAQHDHRNQSPISYLQILSLTRVHVKHWNNSASITRKVEHDF